MKQRNKLNSIDKAKIQARFDMKYNYFITLPLSSLKRIYNENKMSNTDRQALVNATQFVLQNGLNKEEVVKEEN